MQWVPDAQAVTTLVHFPRSPSWMEILPAAILEIIFGTIRGATRFTFPFRIFAYSFSTVSREPMPEPTMTPARKGSSSSRCRSASAKASLAAATAYWEKRSMRFAALGSIRSDASKSLTSAASFTLKLSVSKRVISPIPTRPSRIPCQNSGTVLPMGVTAPSPVTTTRLFIYF